ncbi:caspase family protein [Jannaschia seohaensis]|uniref:Sel1 repeat-containing protein n=1 Tax=Jannaschia seohaensis TaxID=475081 RepID=A0A2Y9AWX2_9RHOB|nr:caspase family protein [Jannaschia seohaensis]PWJ16543.1 Sel1 repeat-containing protein [Jannaschia seohaensis]SSA48780.1 Sel1 repeat-containing protein [Jannaschia seohaensis]
MRAGVALVLAIATALWGGAVRAETRVALVIGNSEYEAIPSLRNPENDALDIAIALEGLGFEVLLGTDLDRQGMIDTAEDFARAASTADIAMLYYAGHGFQADGQNYLIPTDARITRAEDVRPETLPLTIFLDALRAAPGARLVFLDACRDDPFGGAVAGPGVSDGLARVGNEADFLFVYATQPDNVAYDGTGRNSFFTEAVLNHLYTPGQDVDDMMISVRRDVLAATGGRQIPFNNSSLTERVIFDQSPVTATEETLLFQVAAQAEEPSLLQLYLDRYPEGDHAADARAAIEGAFAGAGGTRAIGPEDDAIQADRLWALARRTRMRTLLTYYLERFPDGARAEEARRLLDLAPEPDQTSPGPLCERLATHPNDATASTPGVPFERLRQNAIPAIQACAAARTIAPDLPHYVALLARATAASGDLPRAVTLYGEAAAQGDLRAMVSLAQLMEQGIGMPADPQGALALVQEAAERGSPDAMLNLAVALFNGEGVAPDPDRAVDLLRRAADLGSGGAIHNLGVFAERGVIDTPEAALDYFVRAARAGESTGYRSAAIVLDEGRGVPRDPERAADMLLRAVAEDSGQTLRELTGRVGGRVEDWNRDTLAAVQARLAAAGHYRAVIDGLPGPSMTAALETWRSGGFDAEVLGPLDG